MTRNSARRFLPLALALLPGLTFAPVSGQAPAMLRGTVVDPTGAPLSYANVQLNGGRRYLADDSARFRVPVNVGGELRLLVRRIGFEPTELLLSSAPDSAIQVIMRPIPLELKAVTVTAGASAFVSLDMSGFYQRMKDSDRGITRGHFITPEDIAFRKPHLLTQLIEGIPSVRIRHTLSARGDRIEGTNGCKMTVYLDRVRIVGKLNGADDLVNEIVQTTHIAALEVYSRPLAAPPEYQALNGTCGVVLIWTK